MSDWAIISDGIGKQYRRNTTSRAIRPDTLIGEVGSAFKSLVVKSKERRSDEDVFWALRDVSFEVNTGQRLAIIGANGSGKSTLLKILSRVTAPTEGYAKVRGRVASLLEVGTGFHPELSGRENIYLNGAILGLAHSDINRIMDSIIDFSGVESFLDTPIKHYSSGMHVRLAFAVAAHLEPDILIVDEVLAVGDASFQKKCLGRMDDAAREGRTILFVSHGMASVKALCDRAMLIERGKIACIDDTASVINAYMNSISDSGIEGTWIKTKIRAERNLSSEFARFIEARVETLDGQINAAHLIESSFKVTMQYELLKDVPFKLVPNFHFFDEGGGRIFISTPAEACPGVAGEYTSTCVVPAFCLNVGRYGIRVALSSYELPNSVHFDNPEHLQIEIHENLGSSDERRHGYVGSWPGVTRPRLDWQMTYGHKRDPGMSSYAD